MNAHIFRYFHNVIKRIPKDSEDGKKSWGLKLLSTGCGLWQDVSICWSSTSHGLFHTSHFTHRCQLIAWWLLMVNALFSSNGGWCVLKTNDILFYPSWNSWRQCLGKVCLSFRNQHYWGCGRNVFLTRVELTHLLQRTSLQQWMVQDHKMCLCSKWLWSD